MKASKIAQALDAGLVGPGETDIVRAVHPALADSASDLAVALEPALIPGLAGCAAGAALVPEAADVPEGAPETLIRVRMSRRTLVDATALFRRDAGTASGIHASAVVEPGARIAATARIGPFCHIAADAEIGADTSLGSHCTVREGASTGVGCVIHSGVRIGPGVAIGDRVVIHGNAVIGADGFSFVPVDRGHVETAKQTGRVVVDPDTDHSLMKVHSLGGVVIADDVEIGALTAIDAGTLKPTRIGRGTKIDDLVMIGHNVEVGEDCLLCAHVGIAGSVAIGSRVVLAGGVGVADHLTIGDDVVVGGGSGVGSNLASGTVYVGYPAAPQKEYFRDMRNIRRLRRLLDRMKSQGRVDGG